MKKTQKKSKRSKETKRGRPSEYSRELAEEICDAISESIKGLYGLCEEHPHWPKPQTIRRWRRENEEFSSMYARAKQDQIELLVEQCIEISDDTSRDTLIRQDSQGLDYEVCNHEWINRSRLRVDTRKWYASKLVPRIYGEKTQNEHTGPHGGPIEYANLSPEERNNRIAELLNNARARRDAELCDGDGKGDKKSPS